MSMVDSSDGRGGNKFDKMYICFSTLKQGFRSGCRPLIEVDGCLLKGPHDGILLTVVSVDPNNNLFPIAYVIVSGETRASWEWFLELLKSDLEIVKDDIYTFIFDKQKSLVPAFDSVFPRSDKRATTVQKWEWRMQEMAVLSQQAYDLFSDKPPIQWSKAYFNTFAKCDMMFNNICEAFNYCILDARERPVLTMLEWIREFLVTRLQENRDRT
ncbi:UNVERIFIED_CONTAM: hypothetical protein Sradi_3874800 [Sesamum radiatum]|uniref:MULE transposase domain-containing protein n=1 Tax=Sesamum radiatum TaxID=300843 RepID=A0AAW2Q2B7_SESRA